MAQATRTAGSPAGSPASLSDDPIESVSNWLQLNSKPILYVVVGAAVVAASVFVYRSSANSTREKASVALYQAQGPYAEGNLPEAQKELEKVATRFGSTASGRQASVLLAQVLFEQQKYDEGIQVLEKAVGGAGADFQASMYAIMAAGHEMKADLAKAAESYAKAAGAAKYPAEKYGYQASQARSLMAAGKTDDARKLWESLAALDGEPVQQEANVRLGELAGRQ
jgi:predicted negative regulator of RcsB-dependent stress response